MTPDSLDAWLNQSHADLGELLDVEAGLREILMQSDHEARVDALTGVLDEEAGLSNILEPVENPLWTSSLKAEAQAHELHLFPTEDHLYTITATERMRLRSIPSVTEAVEYVELAREVHHGLSRAQSRTSAQVGADVLRMTLPLVGNVMLIVERNGAGFPNLEQAYACLVETNRLIAEAGVACVVDSPGFVRAVIGAMRCAVELTDAAIEYALTTETGYDGFAKSLLQQDVNVLLDSVRRARNLLVHRDATMPSTDITTQLSTVMELAEGLIGNCVLALQIQIHKHIGRTIPQLAENSIRYMLEDFTSADLTEVDFADVDLTGVRWSEDGTRWPIEMSTETLKAMSEEDPEGSGIYVIRFGASTPFDLVHLL
ncbi:hypothetical protein ACWGCC_34205 [Streptomyces nigrescens]